MRFGDRLQHAWNAFLGRDAPFYNSLSYGGSGINESRSRLSGGNSKVIINSIYTRISTDVAAVSFDHARLDESGRYKESMKSSLNECLKVSANIDETGRAFIQDIVLSMLDEGYVAVVPVETTLNPYMTDSYDITNMRTGKILDWYPEHVRVRVYNEKTGLKEDLLLPKKNIAIIENPFYSVMNEPNSTMQRLIRKLNLLDTIDEATSGSKLNLIVQLPYIIKTDERRAQAEKRRNEIEDQLANSKYGIAYTDGTEKITQLNRSLENDLLDQIKYLTDTLYSQLGMPASVFDGTADEQTMLNYQNRTIEPIVSAIVNEFNRKFLTKTARTRGQSIVFFNDPFRLVPITKMSEIADKFTRNEILSSNEIRQIIGYKPVDNVKADELRNKNLNEHINGSPQPIVGEESDSEDNGGKIQNESR